MLTPESDAAVYDEFKSAGPVRAQQMMADPKIAERLKRESDRRRNGEREI